MHYAFFKFCLRLYRMWKKYFCALPTNKYMEILLFSIFHMWNHFRGGFCFGILLSFYISLALKCCHFALIYDSNSSLHCTVCRNLITIYTHPPLPQD